MRHPTKKLTLRFVLRTLRRLHMERGRQAYEFMSGHRFRKPLTYLANSLISLMLSSNWWLLAPIPAPTLSRDASITGLADVLGRTAAGMKAGKSKGVTFGRKRKLDKEMVRVAAERYAKGETMAELAEVYGVSEPTIWRALQSETAAAA